jgi:hypothetical protein
VTTDEAVTELTKKHGWSANTLAVWRRAGFRCEYCGANLLLSSDVYFLGAHLDHIAPRGGGDGLDNLVA